MSLALPTRPIALASIPAEGLEIAFVAEPDERVALAKHLDLAAIDSLTANVTIRPAHGGRFVLDGRFEADVRPVCVVTLEPFVARHEEPIRIVYAEMSQAPDGDEDAPDPIAGGMIDVGAAVAEFLALALDPYPRRPGARFEYESDASSAPSAFAVLKALREPDER